MSKELVKIVNHNTKVEYKGDDLKNPHLLNYAEKNPDEFEFVYEDVKGKESDPEVTMPKLMAKSVKELQKIASERGVNFGVPMSHLTKGEIANVIIESMKGNK